MMDVGSSEKLTPLMKQYWSFKSAHADKILFFRMGDFYELFYEDAQTVAPLLGLTLTSRNKKAEDETPMCGMPHHSVAGYINRLLAMGFKIAICDQIQDPKDAKGIVERGVTRILSPGMVYDPNVLEGSRPNYLASWDQTHLAFLEPTTGEAFYYVSSSLEEAMGLLEVLGPVEFLVDPVAKKIFESQSTRWLQWTKSTTVTELSSVLGETSATAELLPLAARHLLAYASSMQGESLLKTLRPFESRAVQQVMRISPTTLKHLEIFESYRGETSASLFGAINRTKTWPGARRLKSWLQFPLMKADEISRRQDEVAKWAGDFGRLKALRETLSRLGDVERRLGKISSPTCSPRDLVALRDSLEAGLTISELAGITDSDLATKPGTPETTASGAVTGPARSDSARELLHKISQTLVDEPPISAKEGGVIRKNFSPELQELVELTENANAKLVELEGREREATQISSLKVRYNNVFGYYIEITKTHSAKAPAHYQRKQTLVNAERYTTPELHDLEEKILSAQVRRNELEYQIFSDLKDQILTRASDLLWLAASWSEIDVYQGLAWLALENHYVRPQFQPQGTLELTHSRHPVVEAQVGKQFVPNTVRIGRQECLLLTGPNMAGKSTLMRQVALCVILAQIGSFVPAEKATLPLVDRIFTRIGASDSLAEGLSTFMVEMKETSELLRQATGNTLVVLDEIGRGTSTYDGLSLAHAILEYLVTEKRSYTLFATHYHELTRLASSFPNIQNAHMAIREKNGEIQFTHTLREGPANRSYGIEVARLAGLPPSVLRRATQILKGLEEESRNQVSDLFSWGHEQGLPPSGSTPLDANEDELHFAGESEPLQERIQALERQVDAVKAKVGQLNLNSMTPIQALTWLSEFRDNLEV